MKRLVIIGLAVSATAALAACEKPNPGVSIWSGTKSEYARALCWSPEPNQTVEAGGCAIAAVTDAAAGDGVTTMDVTAGSTVGFSVDPVVADNGWYLAVGGQPQTEKLTSTYYRIQQTQVPAEGAIIDVIALTENGKDTRGIWRFKVVGQQS